MEKPLTSSVNFLVLKFHGVSVFPFTGILLLNVVVFPCEERR